MVHIPWLGISLLGHIPMSQDHQCHSIPMKISRWDRSITPGLDSELDHGYVANAPKVWLWLDQGPKDGPNRWWQHGITGPNLGSKKCFKRYLWLFNYQTFISWILLDCLKYFHIYIYISLFWQEREPFLSRYTKIRPPTATIKNQPELPRDQKNHPVSR